MRAHIRWARARQRGTALSLNIRRERLKAGNLGWIVLASAAKLKAWVHGSS
jgi:hypothetical protein